MAGLVATFALIGTASAHVDIVSSSPAAGSTLATSPATVVVTFDGEIQKTAGSFGLEVTDHDSASVTAGAATVSTDGTHVSVGLGPNLPAGEYHVAWSNTSAEDGDRESGEFEFSVGTSSGDTPTMPDDEADHGGTEDDHSHGDEPEGDHHGDEAAFAPPTTGLIVIALSELNDSNISGRAEILPVDGGARTQVNVFLNGVKPNSSHMAHIHVNTNCAPEPGDHAAELTNVTAGDTTTGRSENIVDVPFSVVANGTHSIFAHVGADPSGDKTPIVCGAIPAQPAGDEHGDDYEQGVSLPSAGTGAASTTVLPSAVPMLALVGVAFIFGAVAVRRYASAAVKS